MSHTVRTGLAVIMSAALAGCATVGPRYERPDLGISATDAFVAAAAPAVEPAEADLRWWRRFGDPDMTRWIERALDGNLDVAAAFERVEQAQALLRAAGAGRSFTLGGRVQTSVNRRSGGGSAGSSGTVGTIGIAGSPAGRSGGSSGATAGLGLGFDWDPDLWGGLRQAEQSAAASLLQSQDLAQAARLATAGASARGYIEWRVSWHEHQALQETLALREDLLRIVRVRVDAGLAPGLDALRAEADVAAARAELDEAAGRTRQAQLALYLLAGERAAAQEPGAASPAPIPQLSGEAPVPRPIDLLRLRPDVRAAERALIASYAEVGVTQAALYPRLRLPGELLLSASGIGTGSIVTALTASLSAILDATLLDGGRRAAELDAARARAREATLVYRRTVLEALDQVESALIAGQTAASQRQARRAAMEASTQALGQARALYTEGLAGFGDVLEAQRSLLANRLELTRSEAGAARAAVATFEAIGLVPPSE
jgi:NodT family efflux transporter outer membrane factor (OMF) lipoprotein